eukprot:scaffold21_cov368-Prasinococcus_capsulatus_cf.AAC.25
MPPRALRQVLGGMPRAGRAAGSDADSRPRHPSPRAAIVMSPRAASPQPPGSRRDIISDDVPPASSS